MDSRGGAVVCPPEATQELLPDRLDPKVGERPQVGPPELPAEVEDRLPLQRRERREDAGPAPPRELPPVLLGEPHRGEDPTRPAPTPRGTSRPRPPHCPRPRPRRRLPRPGRTPPRVTDMIATPHMNRSPMPLPLDGSRPLGVRLSAEGLGTALLLATVVGSGIMGERLAGGNVALALLANSLATGLALGALILALAPVSGAHFNPVVSALTAARGGLRWAELPAYAAVQVAGAFAGVICAHAMFASPLVALSRHERAGVGQLLSEAVATLGLLVVIVGGARHGAAPVAAAVGSWIAGAYWFTASTAFANPAATLARTVTDTFAGIRPADAPGFLGAQGGGALLAFVVIRRLWPEDAPGGQSG